jgi:transposase
LTRKIFDFVSKTGLLGRGIEACASSHHWSRELQALGHTVRLMPPGLREIKRHKNDAADA